MIEVITSSEMKRIERYAIEVMGIPEEVLMETASRYVAQEIINLVGKGKTAMFLCGPGNNGGDGFCAARWHLQLGGKAVVVALSDAQSGAALLNRKILQNMGVRIYRHIPESIGCDIIVDAMFGTGFKGDLTSEYLGAVRYSNGSRKPVIAVDIPSGVDGETGHAHIAVKADVTVTFQYSKLSHYIYPGRDQSGKIIVCDIGIPFSIGAKSCAHILEQGDIYGGILKPRRPNSYKGDYGHVLIVAGSRGMAGAAVLAAQGALKGGAGLVTVACGRESVLPVVQSGAFEAMGYPLVETSEGHISSLNDFDDALRGKAVIAMGCGLGNHPETQRVVQILSSSSLPKVMDADALNVCDGKFGQDTVITPHPGEMARLTGLSTQDITRDPYHIAREYAMQKGVTVLLKGATTVIADKSGQVTLNLTGTPAMSTGGSGDVLTGLIASLLAQGLSCYDAARVGAYLHGIAGELAEKRLGQTSVTAQDIAFQLFAAFKQISAR
jgi:hydroxyethylthiazole kinase-like uncharacterized protein yjeF